MSGLHATKKLVEQLRIECDVTRMPMQQTLREMIAYIKENRESDPLIMGIDKKQNPFQERSSCTVI